jgi:16S rRNA (cytosine967-C5)-methyltransferase
MPLWIIQRLAAEVEPSEVPAAVAAFSRPAPLTIRANRLRTSRERLLSELQKEWPSATLSPEAQAPEAITVTGMGAPEHSASFQAGLFSIQDAGAQRVAHLVEPKPGMRILDACAGVGGKATHMAELSANEAAIVAADSSQRKLDLLADSARRLGISSVEPVLSDLLEPAQVPRGPFDAVLLDAPCSGLGVLRRHPEAKWRLTEDVIAEMVPLQKRLLSNLAGAVAPGGILVYSVCSFVSEEGPRQVDHFLAAHREFKPKASFRTWPHKDNADAFFAAALQRTT